VNTNNGVKWKRFIVPKKVEQINDHLFIDTYKSKNMKIGVNDMTVTVGWLVGGWVRGCKTRSTNIQRLIFLR